MPGQTGGRNQLRGQGYFDIDTGLYKNFTMPWSEKQRLQFRWEAYNVTNTVRFDPELGQPQPDFDREVRPVDRHTRRSAPDAVRAALPVLTAN